MIHLAYAKNFLVSGARNAVEIFNLYLDMRAVAGHRIAHFFHKINCVLLQDINIHEYWVLSNIGSHSKIDDGSVVLINLPRDVTAG